MKNSDLSSEVPNIKVPALMIMGSKETAGVKEIGNEIKYVEDNIRGVEKVFIENAGRTYYMVDNPKKTCNAITDWLKKHPA